jgi:hypothetical protein
MSTQNKKIHEKIKYTAIAVLFLFLFSFNLSAQQTPDAQNPQTQQQTSNDFNDQELKQFANAAEKVIVIQQETEQKMVQVIEEENLEIDKFNSILKAQQSPDAEEVDASEEEMQAFNNATQKLIQIQNKVQDDMVQAIEAEGLEPQKYQEIMLAYQSDPELKARIDALLQE